MPVAANHAGNLPRDFARCPECGKKGMYRYGGTVMHGRKGFGGFPPGKRCKFCGHRVEDMPRAQYAAHLNRTFGATRRATGRGAERGGPRVTIAQPLTPPPRITSQTNKSYQGQLNTLAAMAATGDWKGVKLYQVNGVNTYAKMVARYRDELLAARRERASA